MGDAVKSMVPKKAQQLLGLDKDHGQKNGSFMSTGAGSMLNRQPSKAAVSPLQSKKSKNFGLKMLTDLAGSSSAGYGKVSIQTYEKFLASMKELQLGMMKDATLDRKIYNKEDLIDVAWNFGLGHCNIMELARKDLSS